MKNHNHSMLGMAACCLLMPLLFFIINSVGLYSVIAGWRWIVFPLMIGGMAWIFWSMTQNHRQDSEHASKDHKKNSDDHHSCH